MAGTQSKRRDTYPPPVNRAQLRKSVESLDIPAAALLLARTGQLPEEGHRETEVESGIKSIFDEAQGEALHETRARIARLETQAEKLAVSGDDQNFDVITGDLSGKLQALAKRADLEIPQLVAEQVDAELEKQRFMQLHKLLGDPGFEPHIFRWLFFGLVVVIVEAFLTAFLYAPILGDRGGTTASLLIGFSLAITGIIMARGWIFTRHRRERWRRVIGYPILIAGVLLFLLGTLVASHFRVIISEAGNEPSTADILLSFAETALAVIRSIVSRPEIPFAEPTNLAYFIVSIGTVGSFVFETLRTWGYVGYRRLAVKEHGTKAGLQRKARGLLREIQVAGEQSKTAISHQVARLTAKVDSARELRSELLLIVASHASANSTIAAERQRALAILLDSYRAAIRPGTRIPSGFAVPTASATGAEIAVSDGFDSNLLSLQAEVQTIISGRAQAQAVVDTAVAEAMAELGRLIATEMAIARGLDPPSPPGSNPPVPPPVALEGEVE